MKFCVDVLRGTEALVPAMQSPVEIIGHKLGIPSPLRSKLKNHFSPAFLRAGEITREVLARREKGELTELEKNCYLVRSFDSPHDDVSTEELIELLNITLLASVDTTSSMVNWVIANLACNQEVQDQLRQEVTEAMAGGGFTDQLASKSSLPFLSQVLRETHRLTPSLAVSIMKQVQRDVQLCGYDIPAGKVVSLDAFSIQNDPAYVDKPEAFVPSRWSAEEVSKRKGTPKEIIDHRLLADPFSAGARMCPGSRVANMEVRCLLSHLVRSYRFEWQGGGPISAADIPYQQGSTIQPNPLPPLKITPV
mmetsp:Transcript_59318/g.128924  ORF Transcript_59318/g.128924 Transcript_59318/m.128924 type:complete len:307 (-) Transcript_59318:10-930(-)